MEIVLEILIIQMNLLKIYVLDQWPFIVIFRVSVPESDAIIFPEWKTLVERKGERDF